MIPENVSPGLHGTLTLIEHPLSEMEGPHMPSRPYRNPGGSGGSAPGASVREGTSISRPQKTIFIAYA